MKELDILILSMPQLFLDRAPGAPAILKSSAIQAGFSARTGDLSIDFFINEANRSIDQFNKLTNIFRPSEVPRGDSIEASRTWLDRTILKIKELKPRMIGISVFTVFQHRASYLLTQEIRKHCPDTLITIGGMGLNISCSSMSGMIDLKKSEVLDKFHTFLEKRKLCDDVILGTNGYSDLVDVLEKRFGRRKEIQKDESTKAVLFKSPIPDYDDYDLNNYVWAEKPALPITGSKGCVRKCTFCDIPGQFGRFQIRTGQDIAEEMIHLADRHDVRKFEFTDSLVNGSLKAFRDWMTIVADYNDKQPVEKKVTWFGQYICRPQKEMPEDMYDLMARSGVVNLVIGTESGSDKVLESMKKKMTVQDVYDELVMFEKYNIKTQFLMFSGFYNETRQDFEDTLKFLINCQKYVANGVITKFTVGPPLYINTGTYLYDHAEELGLMLDIYDDLNWTVKGNEGYDLLQRIINRLTQQLIVDKLGFSSSGQAISILHQMNEKLRKMETDLTERINESTPVTAD